MTTPSWLTGSLKASPLPPPIPSSIPPPFPLHHHYQQHQQHQCHHYVISSIVITTPFAVTSTANTVTITNTGSGNNTTTLTTTMPVTPSQQHHHYHHHHHHQWHIVANAVTPISHLITELTSATSAVSSVTMTAITSGPALCLWADTSWALPSPTLNPPHPGHCVGRNRLAGSLTAHHACQSRWAEPRQPHHHHHLILHTADHTPPSKVNLKVIPSKSSLGQERVMVTVLTPPSLLTWKLSCLLHLLPSAS